VLRQVDDHRVPVNVTGRTSSRPSCWGDNPYIPSLGASGAISGVMGGYAA
jgi:membrane associated rhomboid family serine protease